MKMNALLLLNECLHGFDSDEQNSNSQSHQELSTEDSIDLSQKLYITKQNKPMKAALSQALLWFNTIIYQHGAWSVTEQFLV